MTAQIPDVLHFDGNQYPLYCEPLEAFFKQNPPRPEIKECSTACWRGYVATWEISESRLYLKRLYDFYEGRLKLKEKFFPNDEGDVFASWYTGPLICLNGPRVEYVHMGYASTFEKYLIVEIEHGLVVKTTDMNLDEYRLWQEKRYG